jgi:hypothetical protein
MIRVRRWRALFYGGVTKPCRDHGLLTTPQNWLNLPERSIGVHAAWAACGRGASHGNHAPDSCVTRHRKPQSPTLKGHHMKGILAWAIGIPIPIIIILYLFDVF